MCLLPLFLFLLPPRHQSKHELNFHRLTNIALRPSSVPSTKAAQCRRHAATAGLQVPSEYIGEGDGTETSGGLIHSSSSSQSNGESYTRRGTNGIIDEEMNLDSTGSSSSSVPKKRRSFLVKEDQPEKERVCSISTRYNGQRGPERCDKTRERQDLYDGYELGSSARKKMRVDVSAKSSGMSRRVRSSRVAEIPSSSLNPIDLCEDDSDVTTAETSDLPTGGTPDTPTSSDVAAEVASDVAADVASDVAAEAASDVASEVTAEVVAVLKAVVVAGVTAPEMAVTGGIMDEIAVTGAKLNGSVVKMDEIDVKIDNPMVRTDEIVDPPVDAQQTVVVLHDPPSLKVEEAIVVNCVGELGLQIFP
jgi:hypothetical protein